MKKMVSVVLPTYNEAGNIGPLLRALRDVLPSAELIVVDDSSTDGTLDEARKALPADARVRLHVRTSNRGLAPSILDGIRLAQGDSIAVLDTDFSHDPALLPIMFDNLRHFDIVSGSRYVHGGGMYSPWRYAFSYLFNLFARHLLGTRLTDHLSGFFMIRREALASVDAKVGLENVFSGYGDYYIKLLFHLVAAGSSILEIPSWYKERPHGASKTRFLRTFVRYTATTVALRLKHGQAWPVRRRHAAATP